MCYHLPAYTLQCKMPKRRRVVHIVAAGLIPVNHATRSWEGKANAVQ